MSPTQAERELIEGSRNCGRTITAREISDAITKAYSTARTYAPRLATPPAAKWPARNEKLIVELTREGFGLSDLWESSPIRFEEPATEWLIDQLFPGSPLLCCGKTAFDFATKTREEWRGTLSDLALIVPSAMSSPTGHTQDGKESPHCLSNTGSRQYLVVEFDQGTPDQHAAVLAHLAEKAVLAMAVHSGNKSLHGWFAVHGLPEAKVRSFFCYAVALGADPHLWTRSQFVRMPDAIRDNGRRQSVFYFNPNIKQEVAHVNS